MESNLGKVFQLRFQLSNEGRLQNAFSLRLFRREPRATLSGADHFRDVWRPALFDHRRRSIDIHATQVQRLGLRAGKDGRAVQELKHGRDDNHERL